MQTNYAEWFFFLNILVVLSEDKHHVVQCLMYSHLPFHFRHSLYSVLPYTIHCCPNHYNLYETECYKTGTTSIVTCLRKNEQLIVLPADKGNTTVIMDSSDYRNKIAGLLEDDTYRKVQNPNTWIKKTIPDLIKSSTRILEDKKKNLLVYDPRTPLLLSLIHI